MPTDFLCALCAGFIYLSVLTKHSPPVILRPFFGRRIPTLFCTRYCRGYYNALSDALHSEMLLAKYFMLSIAQQEGTLLISSLGNFLKERTLSPTRSAKTVSRLSFRRDDDRVLVEQRSHAHFVTFALLKTALF